MPVRGTSAATPLVAGIAALVNQAIESEAATSPRPQLGFTNPLIYDIAARQAKPSQYILPQALRDVTTANNDISNVGCCDAGVGYDLATGWGSVYAADLLDAATATGTAPTITDVQPGYGGAQLTVECTAGRRGLPDDRVRIHHRQGPDLDCGRGGRRPFRPHGDPVRFRSARR